MTFMFVPIPRAEKKPNQKGWNLEENCLKDFDSLSGMNVGLAHAFCSPPTCALDIDHWPSAKNHFEAIGLDIRKMLRESGAAIIHSGRQNSLKAMYTLPESVGRMPTKAVKTDDRVAYELRCAASSGHTVTDVIPPSIHPQGTPYRWVQNDLDSLSQIPKLLLVHWLQLLEEDKPQKQNAAGEAPSFINGFETPRKIALLREQLSYVNPDCDYFTWRDVLWAILSTGFPSAGAIAQEWSAGVPDRYNHDHFLTVVESWRHDRAKHSLGTIYHYARLGGWHG